MCNILPFAGCDDDIFGELYSDNFLLLPGYEQLIYNPTAAYDRHNVELDPTVDVVGGGYGQSADCSYFNQDEFNDLSEYNFDFNSLFYNIRSMNANFDEFICDFKPNAKYLDVLGLVETRLSGDIDCLYMNSLSKYNFVSNPRNLRGGGVCLFVSRRYEMSVMGEITLSLAHFESLFVTIKLNGRSIVVGCIYRSPSSCIGDFLSTLNNVLGEVSNVGLSNVVIGGDINVDLLKGSNLDNCRYRQNQGWSY